MRSWWRRQRALAQWRSDRRWAYRWMIRDGTLATNGWGLWEDAEESERRYYEVLRRKP